MTASRQGLTAGLNQAQLAAVTAGDGPLLVVAGPGSGKTRVLTHRVAWLVAGGVPAASVLAVTFTNKAATELRERLDALVDPGTGTPWVGTFHAVCARILRHHAEQASLPTNFSIADTTSARRHLRDALVDCEEPSDDDAVRRAASVISRARNSGNTAAVFAADPTLAQLPHVLAQYRERLHRAGLVDFDGLLEHTAALLSSEGDVVEQYRSRLHTVLVDEAQDTNDLQYHIAKVLASGTGNLCLVGDADQSLYSWRGASAKVFDRFSADHPGAQVVVLEENYRSSGAIVSLAQAVIAPNTTRFRPKLVAVAPWGAPVEAMVLADELAEADWLGRFCATAGGEVAVLVRTNAQCRLIEEAFTRHRVLYQVVGGPRFFERAEVRDAVAWLRAAATAGDTAAFVRAAATPPRGVGAGALGAVDALATARQLTFGAALDVGVAEGVFPNRSSAALARFSADLAQVRAAAVDGPAAALMVVRDALGLDAAVRRGPDGEDRVANLDELSRAAASFDSLEEFLTHAALAGAEHGEAGAGKVSLVTVHAAKGREWDTVVVAGVEDGLFPHHKAVGVESRAEERRLLYVAVTRARHRLVLTRAERRRRGPRWADSAVSPFVSRLPVSLLPWKTLGTRAFGGHKDRLDRRRPTRPQQRW
jgi:DNA helicase-2/ATP-dependent DNA helicase PcrA